MKKEEIVNLNRTLLYVSFGNMSKAGKSAMMRNLVRLGKHSKEIEEAMKIAFDKFKPAGLDGLMKKKDRSEEEQKELDDLTKKFDDDIRNTHLSSWPRRLRSRCTIFPMLTSMTWLMPHLRYKGVDCRNFMYLREYLVKE